MKSRPLSLFALPQIECLESRIAPAAIINAKTILYKDYDGDLVQLTVSKSLFTSASVANSILTFCDANGNVLSNAVDGGSTTAEQLCIINLTQAPAFPLVQDMNISVKVLPHLGSGGDGKVNVGYIEAGSIQTNGSTSQFIDNSDLGTVTIQGDLGGIICGDNYSDTALKSLNVQSLGNLNSAEVNYNNKNSAQISIISNVQGPIGSIHVAGDVDGASLSVVGGQYGVFGTIGSITIGGSLKSDASSAGSSGSGGIFQFTQSIGSITIGGNIVGGSGSNGSSIFYGDANDFTSIGSITVKGSIYGGAGGDSGAILASALSSLKIGGDIDGGDGENSGSVSMSTISSAVISGAINGGAGPSSGQIVGDSFIGFVSVGKGVVGGAGDSSGTIDVGLSGTLSKAVINQNSSGNSLQGGDGSDSGEIGGFGSVRVPLTTSYANLSSLLLFGNISGGDGSTSGSVAVGDIGSLTLDGSLIGGVYHNSSENAQFSGEIAVTDTISSLTIKGGITADSTSSTGAADSALVSAQTIHALTVDGSITGGTGSDSGEIYYGSSLGKAVIGQTSVSGSGNITGGAGSYSGSIKGGSGSTLASLVMTGSLTGATGANSGDITGGTLTSASIGGNIQGGTAGQDAVAAQTGPPAVAATSAVAGHSGAILFTNIGAVTLGGSLIGGVYTSSTQNAQESGEIVATGTFSNLTIDGSVTADSTSATGAVDSAWVSAGTLTALTIDGSIIGGTGSDSGEVHYSSSLGTAVIGKTSDLPADSITGGAGSYSGSIKGDSGSTLTSLTLNGSLIGAAGVNSGDISGATLSAVTITGDVQGGTAGATSSPGDTGAILATGSIASLKIGGDVLGSSGSNSGYINATGNISKLVISGSLEGGNGDQSGMIVLGGELTTAVIGKNIESGSASGISNSGSIRVGQDIGSLLIGGDVQGNTTNKVYISALGQAGLSSTSTTDLAINSLTIQGNIDQAEILAGYGADPSVSVPRGSADNGNAQIGAVKIGTTAHPGNLSATSIVAGATAGTDTEFGTSDDKAISTTTNEAIASIASIIITGTATGADNNGSTNYGFVAVDVKSYSIGNNPPVTVTNPTSGQGVDGSTTLSVIDV